MNSDSKDLMKLLTSRRPLSDKELDDSIGRAALRVLRHEVPDSNLHHDWFGLIDFDRFVSYLSGLFEAIPLDRLQFTIDQLIAMEKIEIRSDKIRALYGHSLRGVIVGPMKWPEIKLFHATCKRHLNAIFEYGLRSQSRTWVHLTSDVQYASRILKNHSFDGPPALLSIDARKLEGYDVTFRQPNSHVWLANHIPYPAIEVDCAGETKEWSTILGLAGLRTSCCS